jgi:hypothetical protein
MIGRFFLIESGPLREWADAEIKEAKATSERWTAWANHYHHDGGKHIGILRGEVIGLRDVDLSDPAPWRVKKIGSESIWVPRVKCPQGREIQAQIDRLPTCRMLDTTFMSSNWVGDKIGWARGQLAPPVLHCRYAVQPTIILRGNGFFGPGPVDELKRLRALPIPGGCREIDEVEWLAMPDADDEWGAA